jgi:LuxR family maltose regulon positive regulatory protein
LDDPLLTTKLFPPPPRTELVPRPRLVERLESGLRLRRKLALVSAPAGFGKTTLTVEAARKTGYQTAWLSLEAAENDLIRFWRYVVAALRQVSPRAGELAQAMLEQNQPPPVETILTSLLNDLAVLPDPLLLVLDDYHVVETRAVHDSLNFFLDHLPPQVFLMITTRADPPLALARRRSRAEMVEVRAADLRFSHAEALAFLNQAMRLGLSAADVDALLRRTEGWIAGLQMAALAMQGLEIDPAGGPAPGDAAGMARRAFIATFAGDDQYIGDYLVEEVLQRQPAPVQAFLLESSVLDRLCASLCDAVVHSSGAPFGGLLPPAPGAAQEILSYLEHANLFVTPLDNRQEWFRYHRLFADLLRRRLASLAGQEHVRRLHGRASRWYEGRELWAEAVDHALAAGDEPRAVDLVEKCQEGMFRRSELVTFREWILRLPRELVLSRPSLCIPWGWAALSTGHGDEAAQAIEAVERVLSLTADSLAGGPVLFDTLPEGVVPLLVNLAMLRASLDMAHLDFQSAIRRAQQVLDCAAYYQGKATLSNVQEFTSVAYFDIGGAYEALGAAELAAAAFEKAIQDSQKGGNLHILPMAMSHLAQIQAVRGRLKEAAETYQQALVTAAQFTGKPSPLVSIAHAGLGSLLYEWNDLEKAREHFEHTLILGKPWNNWESLLPAYLGMARITSITGSSDQAAALLDEASRGWRQLYNPAAYPGFEAWKALILDDPVLIERALRRYESAGPPVEAFLAHAHEMDQHLLARLLLRLGRLQDAQAILATVDEKARSSERWGIVVQNRILQSVLELKQNALERALGCLEEALVLAEPGGYIRSFVDGGAPVARLLYTIRGYRGEKAGLARYAGRLMASFPGGVFDLEPQPSPGQAVTPSPGAPLVEPLTGREIEILRLVALGLANSEIAARLVISPGTVKVHTNNIYAKLGVNNRARAVARARLLGILA